MSRAGAGGARSAVLAGGLHRPALVNWLAMNSAPSVATSSPGFRPSTTSVKPSCMRPVLMMRLINLRFSAITQIVMVPSPSRTTADAGTAVAWPLAARAQQPHGTWRVGNLGLAPVSSPNQVAFRSGLHDLGYIDGQNLILEYGEVTGAAASLASRAAELVKLRVDVIFAAGGSEATRAARQQTTEIPIVTISSNPVGLGFVASLARPGGNVTGLSLQAPEVSGKRLELLKQIVPEEIVRVVRACRI